MSRKEKVWVLGLLVLAMLLALGFYLHNTNIPVLEPKGEIGQKERNLMLTAVGLSVIVVVPVFIMLFTFAWKYREGNPKPKKYEPDWDHSRLYETIWWGVPLAIITVLGVIAWRSSHQLDPFKPIASKTAPITIQVVALDWKWLFVYPSQNVATLNFVQFPINTPVNFDITADAPMNSFWIPQLGGQIYAMPGMSTQLHLIANQAGNYEGRSANISGTGFSGMTFTAEASNQTSFNKWLKIVKSTSNTLSLGSYNNLAKPSQNNPVVYYSSAASNLYSDIINKYMAGNDQMVGMGI